MRTPHPLLALPCWGDSFSGFASFPHNTPPTWLLPPAAHHLCSCKVTKDLIYEPQPFHLAFDLIYRTLITPSLLKKISSLGFCDIWLFLFFSSAATSKDPTLSLKIHLPPPQLSAAALLRPISDSSLSLHFLGRPPACLPSPLPESSTGSYPPPFHDLCKMCILSGRGCQDENRSKAPVLPSGFACLFNLSTCSFWWQGFQNMLPQWHCRVFVDSVPWPGKSPHPHPPANSYSRPKSIVTSFQDTVHARAKSTNPLSFVS